MMPATSIPAITARSDHSRAPGGFCGWEGAGSAAATIGAHRSTPGVALDGGGRRRNDRRVRVPRGPVGVVLKAMHRAVGVRRRLQGPLRPTWSHELETMATALRLWGKQSIRLPLAIQRGALIARFEPTEAIRQTACERITACGPPAEWLRRVDSDRATGLLYLHGGGYSIGSIDTHRDLLCRLCAASGASVLAVDYRLAPEHPFPAQLEDALAAYRWLLDAGHDPARI